MGDDNGTKREMRVIANGLNPKKVIIAYQHFGSLRKTARACGISKDTVVNLLKRFNVEQIPRASLPKHVALNPHKKYSSFAKWHKDHMQDENIPSSINAIAKLAGVSSDVVKCYMYRKRKRASKMLKALPDLRTLNVDFEDIEGNTFNSSLLIEYQYVIDRFSEKAALRGKLKDEALERTAILPSIELFCSRIKQIATLS